MKTKHTPGPWRFELSTKTIRSVPTNYWLATMDSWDGAVDNEANARLIAAAPELLAELKRSSVIIHKLCQMVKYYAGPEIVEDSKWPKLRNNNRRAAIALTEKE